MIPPIHSRCVRQHNRIALCSTVGPRDRRGATAFELVFLLLILLSAVIGLLWGVRLGSEYGTPGAVAGGVVGPILGIVGAVLVSLLAALVCEPFDGFGRWWRPYPPTCENGTCRGLPDYKGETLSEDILLKIKGLSWYGWRCRCGHLYAGGYGYGMQNRWVRVLPDGTIRPYLKYRAFGRWRPDDETVIEPGRIERDLERFSSMKVPGWLIPCLATAVPAGMASFVVYRDSGFANPIASWFVAGCAAVGLLTGCVIWWMGPAHFEDRG